MFHFENKLVNRILKSCKKEIMESLNRIFFRGLITFIPIALTIYIVYSAVNILENIFGNFLRQVLKEAYVPGIGFILTLIVIFSFGLMLNNYVTRRILSAIEKRLNEIPFVKTIYSPLRDLMNLFSKKDKKGLQSVVMVQIGEAQIIGLVTRDSFNDLQNDLILSSITENKVAVYIPFSYALGGCTVLLPKTAVKELNLPIEKAMSLAITGWVKN